jgi:hypothetical protein
MPSSTVLICCSLLFADNPQFGNDSRVVRCRDVRVKVFWHHPGIIDSKENMQAKVDDEQTIMQALKKNSMSYRYSGGLGRDGYTLEIYSREYEAWKTMIEDLSADSRLRYYKPGSVDRHGFGFLPVKEEDLFLK